METPKLVRGTSHGVTLLGDPGRPCGVTLAFTERTGGVSTGAYASLNLGVDCGDKPEHVAENRRRALRAMGWEHLRRRLVNPLQVHGTHLVSVTDTEEGAIGRAQEEARTGADGVICTVPDVPVLLCSADCALVTLVAPGGFAVVHSGWKGTLGRISGKALQELCQTVGCTPSDVCAYVGPHIAGDDYVVSEDLLNRFVDEFGASVRVGAQNLSLEAAITSTLVEAGVNPGRMAYARVSTMRATERFFSYRASHGTCGRMGALACLKGNGDIREAPDI